MDEPAIYFSPLQGYTDFRFRNAYHQHFAGVDCFYAPYIRLDGQGEIKASIKKDLLPGNNSGIRLVPQVLTRDAGDFLAVARYVSNLGYRELNWNLGCPYPMVARRGMGSGLLASPGTIDQILSRVMGETGIGISVKMRLGYLHPEEILAVLPVLDKFALTNIVIHPRTGKQMYGGTVDPDAFERCLGRSRHTILYNGDITSLETFRRMQDRFPGIGQWMIGRGLIADPFLPASIKADTPGYPPDATEIFSHFQESLLAAYSEALSGQKHTLQRMYQLWVYFIHLFPQAHKGLKSIKKAQTLEQYRRVVDDILAHGIGEQD